MPTPPLASPSAAKPLAGGVNPSAAANPAVQPGLPVRTIAEERRRGQRVLLRIRANAHITTKAKETEVVAVTTLSVNPACAMLISPRNLAAQTRFVLEHSGTKEKIECRVVSMPKHSPGATSTLAWRRIRSATSVEGMRNLYFTKANAVDSGGTMDRASECCAIHASRCE